MSKFPFPLVVAVAGEPRASTLAISAGVQRAHAGVIKLVRRYLPVLQRMGRVGFEIRPFETAGGTQSQEVALLNEHQATLLISFMRNTAKVIEFKVALVMEFFRMRDELSARATGLWQLRAEAEAQLLEQNRFASLCGRGLSEHKHLKPPLVARLDSLDSAIQIPLIPN